MPTPNTLIRRFDHTSPQTLKGPGGLSLVLDPKQVFPNNPGDGTPLMVYRNHGQPNEAGATLACALGEGELTGTFTDKLHPAEYNWLEHLQEDADAWLTATVRYFQSVEA